MLLGLRIGLRVWVIRVRVRIRVRATRFRDRVKGLGYESSG